jgi:HK97 gp10 family phage protein
MGVVRKTVDIREMSSELRKLAQEFNGFGWHLHKIVLEELVIGLNAIRTAIIRGMKGTPRATHFYIRGGKKHHPSSPNNFPAIDSGELIRSIVMDVQQTKTNSKVYIGADTGAPYAKYLEEGTPKMLPRPWLEPTVEAHTQRIVNRLITRIKRETT